MTDSKSNVERKTVLLVSKKHRKKPGKIRFRWACIPLLCIVLFGACASAPKYHSIERPVHFLPGSSQLIGKMNAGSNRKLFSEIAKGFLSAEGDTEQALQRAENVFFAYNISKDNRKIVSLIIQGKFPKSITTALIQKEEGWSKHEGEVPWWSNAETGMQIAVPERNMIFISTGLMGEMIARYVSVQPRSIVYEVLKEIEVSDLVLYLGDPASGFMEGLPVDTKKFPLSSLWFTLYRSGSDYYMSGVFMLNNKKQANAMAMLSKIFMVGWFRQHKLSSVDELKENMQIKALGDSVRISGISLDDSEVLRLLFSFLPEESF